MKRDDEVMEREEAYAALETACTKFVNLVADGAISKRDLELQLEELEEEFVNMVGAGLPAEHPLGSRASQQACVYSVLHIIVKWMEAQS